ncbi:MAG: S41 family peptidase [Bacteroidetes bacterium]|nr:S41 family peptidase [Bacteroidota bacterium]
MKERALGSASVDWEGYNERLQSILSKSHKADDIFQLLGSVFTDIGDFHGGFFYNGVRYGMKQADLTVRQELQDGFKIGASVKSRIFREEYGYIFIPPVNSNGKKGSTDVADEIDSILCNASPKIKGWIVDLRLNLGGNMYPMIAGLRSLLGEGRIGTFVTKNHETIEWIISKGSFRAGTDSVTLTNSCDFDGLPVVVLISQVTASSGEAAAIAFKGREKTLFLGESTSGYITALNNYQLSTHGMLLVAEAYMCDRNGHCYTTKLTPDIVITHGDHFIDLEKDEKVTKALSWLKQQ